MQDGKQISIPYGRRNPVLSKGDLEELLLKIIDLESRVAKLEADAEHEPQEGDKPKRGRKPKEAIE
jgi:hypothetical protein